MQELTRSSQALQTMVMQVRMIEVEAVFLRFPRLVRDLSSKLGKQVQLTLTGGETGLDRTVVDRKSTRLNSSHANISHAVFCLKKQDRGRGRRGCPPPNRV